MSSLVELIIDCFFVDHCCLWLVLWDWRLWLTCTCGRQWNEITCTSEVLHFTQNEGFINHKKDRYMLCESNEFDSFFVMVVQKGLKNSQIFL